jgi:hypothetical protein
VNISGVKMVEDPVRSRRKPPPGLMVSFGEEEEDVDIPSA